MNIFDLIHYMDYWDNTYSRVFTNEINTLFLVYLPFNTDEIFIEVIRQCE